MIERLQTRWGAVHAKAATAGALAAILAAWVIMMSIVRQFLATLNSDQLYLANFTRDVFEGRPISTWRLQPAPSFFPDMPMYLAAAGSTRDLGHAFAAYATLYLGALVGGATLLARAVGVPGRRGCYAVAAWVLLLRGYGGQWLVYTPAHHGGTLVTIVYLLAVVVDSRGGAKRLGVLAVLAMLASASDLLVIPQILIPLCVALVVMAALSWRRGDRRPRGALWRAGALAGGAAAGYALLAFALIPYGLVPHADIPRPILAPGEMGQFLRGIALYAEQAPMFAALVAAAILWAVGALVRTGPRPPSPDDHPRLLATFCLLALPAVALTPVLAMSWHVACDRYLLALYFLPILLLVLMGDSLPRSFSACTFVVVFGLWVWCGGAKGLERVELPSPDRLRAPEAPWIACIDRFAQARRIRVGFAPYWDANRISHYGRGGLRAFAMTGDARPYVWLVNRDWFYALHRAPPDQVLVVMNEIDEEDVLTRLGPPRETARCEDKTIQTYAFATAAASQRAILSLTEGRE